MHCRYHDCNSLEKNTYLVWLWHISYFKKIKNRYGAWLFTVDPIKTCPLASMLPVAIRWDSKYYELETLELFLSKLT